MSENTSAPDPEKLLGYWNEWEQGNATPGKLLADLKRAGLPDLLQSLSDKQS